MYIEMWSLLLSMPCFFVTWQSLFTTTSTLGSGHHIEILSSPKDMWNKHVATTLPRSSNIASSGSWKGFRPCIKLRSSYKAKGWDCGFNRMLSCSNPTIWNFLECLKTDQDLTGVNITNMMVQKDAEPKFVKWRRSAPLFEYIYCVVIFYYLCNII